MSELNFPQEIRLSPLHHHVREVLPRLHEAAEEDLLVADGLALQGVQVQQREEVPRVVVGLVGDHHDAVLEEVELAAADHRFRGLEDHLAVGRVDDEHVVVVVTAGEILLDLQVVELAGKDGLVRLALLHRLLPLGQVLLPLGKLRLLLRQVLLDRFRVLLELDCGLVGGDVLLLLLDLRLFLLDGRLLLRHLLLGGRLLPLLRGQLLLLRRHLLLGRGAFLGGLCLLRRLARLVQLRLRLRGLLLLLGELLRLLVDDRLALVHLLLLHLVDGGALGHALVRLGLQLLDDRLGGELRGVEGAEDVARGRFVQRDHHLRLAGPVEVVRGDADLVRGEVGKNHRLELAGEVRQVPAVHGVVVGDEKGQQVRVAARVLVELGHVRRGDAAHVVDVVDLGIPVQGDDVGAELVGLRRVHRVDGGVFHLPVGHHGPPADLGPEGAADPADVEVGLEDVDRPGVVDELDLLRGLQLVDIDAEGPCAGGRRKQATENQADSPPPG